MTLYAEKIANLVQLSSLRPKKGRWVGFGKNNHLKHH
jgi:hypothetical protein